MNDMKTHLFILNAKQAVRHLYKYGWQTVLSVFGMVLGVVCLSYSLNWIWNELHYDSFRKGYEDVYMCQVRFYEDSLAYANRGEFSGCQMYLSAPTYEEMRKDLPEGADLSLIVTTIPTLKDDAGNDLQCSFLRGVDSVFANIFDLQNVRGNAAKALSVPDQMVLTRSRAKKMFGSEDKAMGQRVHMAGGYIFPGDRVYVVSAIIEDNQPMSNMELDILVGNFNAIAEYDRTASNNFNYQAVVRTKNVEALENAWSMINGGEVARMRVGATPLRTAHLLGNKVPSQLWRVLIYPLAFTAVSILLLLSAFFNYIAILTSIFLGRVREYSLRISVGGTFRQNFAWISTEVGITLLAVLLMSSIVLEWINFLFDIPEASSGVYSTMLLCMAGYVLLVMLGVCYPAYRLKRIYKSQFNGKPVNLHINNVMLLFQLMVCFLLVFVALTAYRQMHMIFTADLGFTTTDILRINTCGPNTGQIGNKFYDIEERLNNRAHTAVVQALAMQSDLFESMGRSSTVGSSFGITEEPYCNASVRLLTLPYATKDFFQLKVTDGTWFKEPVDVFNEQPVLLNPEAVEALHLQDYATRHDLTDKSDYHEVEPGNWGNKTVPLHIMGVVSFRTRSLHEPQEPLLIHCSPTGRSNHGAQWNHNAIYVKHKPGMEAEARQEITKVLKDFGVDSEGVEVERMSDRVLKFYDKEQNYLNVFTVITSGSVLITLFGVLSMILYLLRLQRRSLAVRRVFGASFAQINRMYLKGYLLYTVIACIVAYPVALYVSNWWLENFDVTVSVGIVQGLCIFACMFFLVALVVVLQVARTMRENPAQVIRNE